MYIEQYGQPLQEIIPSYLYFQYTDDMDLQAFVNAFNSLTQGYLDWFNENPLSIYTMLSGYLLDYVMNNLYGIFRPVLQNSITYKISSIMATQPMATVAMGTNKVISIGSSQALSDDYFQRYLTWILYLGDGRQVSIPWLRRRLARFIYGANGSDISADYFQYVSVGPSFIPNKVGMGASAMGTQFMAQKKSLTNVYAKSTISISLPNTQASIILQQLINQNILPLPFQCSYEVIIS